MPKEPIDLLAGLRRQSARRSRGTAQGRKHAASSGRLVLVSTVAQVQSVFDLVNGFDGVRGSSGGLLCERRVGGGQVGAQWGGRVIA